MRGKTLTFLHNLLGLSLGLAVPWLVSPRCAQHTTKTYIEEGLNARGVLSRLLFTVSSWPPILRQIAHHIC